MNFLLKVFNNPLLIFVVIAIVWYSTRDILALTAALMVVVTLQVLIEKIVKGEVGKVLFISWCLLIPLGSLTLLLRDPVFLQWKFSIIHWLLALILLGSLFLKGPFLLKRMFISIGPELKGVPEKAWVNVTYFIGVSLLIIGTINLYFIYFSDIPTWVNFKLYGVTLLNIAATSSALFYLFSKVPTSIKN